MARLKYLIPYFDMEDKGHYPCSFIVLQTFRFSNPA